MLPSTVIPYAFYYLPFLKKKKRSKGSDTFIIADFSNLNQSSQRTSNIHSEKSMHTMQKRTSTISTDSEHYENFHFNYQKNDTFCINNNR